MLTLVFAALVVATVIWLISRRPAAALAAFLIVFALTTRTLSLIYVDLAGPMYAVELGDYVGGGQSMPLFACSVLTLLIPLAYLFRPAYLQQLRNRITASPLPSKRRIANIAFMALCLFLIALYLDMFLRGPIPLISGMDRLEYNKLFAGPLHPLVFEHGFLFAAPIGCLFVYPRLSGKDFDFRFVGLLVAFLLYFALTGNRFSAFFAFSSFFVLPLAAVLALRSARALPPPPRRTSRWKSILVSRSGLHLALISGSALILMLLLNSFVTVRGYDDPTQQFQQRTLIQPVELWWTTWNGLADRLSDSFDDTWDYLFVNAIDPKRNTSIQMLMARNLGYDRASDLIDLGQQYAGGYPEVLFELLGPWFALPVALAFGIITAMLIRLIVESVCLGKFATAFFALYVYDPFSILYIGGMLNFLIAWTFWAKCGVLLLLYILGRYRARREKTRERRRAISGNAATTLV